MLRRLPEATLRWRAALSGRDLPPVPDDDARAWTGDEPTTTLVDAFDLLVRVLRTVEREGLDVPPATPGVTDAAQPVGEAYAWPAGVAWEVQIIEGLLGLAARRPLAPAADTFFTAPVTPREPCARPDPPSAAARTAPLACALLALEWALCAKDVEAAASPDATPSNEMVRALGQAMSAAAPAGGGGGPEQVESERVAGVLFLSTAGAEPSLAVELPIVLDWRALVRADTGAVDDARLDEAGATVPSVTLPLVVRAGTPGRSASIAFRAGRPEDAPGHDAGRRVRSALHIRPRVLTDAGVPRSNIAYMTAQGAVCVGHFATSSVVVRPDGSVVPGQAWPQPITGELPLEGNGSGGVVRGWHGLGLTGAGVCHAPCWPGRARERGAAAVQTRVRTLVA